MRFLKRDLPFLCVLAVAAAMLVFSSTSVTRSALRYESQLYKGEVEAKNIGVTLRENGTAVAWRYNNRPEDGVDNAWVMSEMPGPLLGNLLEPNEKLIVGKQYDEVLTAYNSGTIPEYVRMILRRYWVDDSGKRLDRDVNYIDLHLTGNWIEDTSWSDDASAHPETTVLYYPSILQPGTESAPATDHLTINNFAASRVTQTKTEQNGGYVITTVYDYDGLRFAIEAEVDAVQTHNASDAMKSAWGIDAMQIIQ